MSTQPTLRRLLVLALCLAALAAAPAALPAVPIGTLIQISPNDGFDHVAPDLAADEAGAVVVWQATGQGQSGYDIFARRLGPDGPPQGGPFRVNADPAGEQRRPTVAMLADGGFVVAWDTGTRAVFFRRYGPDGAPRDPADRRASSTITGSHFNPAVAALPGGAFVIAWQFAGAADRDGDGVLVQRYDAGGAPAGGSARPYDAANDDGVQSGPALASGPDGTFVVAWEEQTLGATPAEDRSAILFSRYSRSGAALALARPVATGAADELRDPDVAIDSATRPTVVWASFPGGPPLTSRIDGRHFDATGAPLGPAFTISATAPAARSLPALSAGNSGALAVWIDAGTVHSEAAVGLAARGLDPAGVPAGDEIFPRPPLAGGDPVYGVAAAATPDGVWIVWGQEPLAIEGNDAVGTIYVRRLGQVGTSDRPYRVNLPIVGR